MQTLLVIFGPPAVGKMTVGRAIAARSGFRLFHNHATIEPLLEVFEFGTPPFQRLLEAWRQQVVDEAAGAGLDLILTFVWGLDLADDLALLEDYVRPFAERDARIAFVELYADLDTRLARNATGERLDAKPSKRDLEWSDANLRSFEAHEISTRPDRRTRAHALLDRHDFLRLDNSAVPAEESARRILDWLGAEGGVSAAGRA